MDKLDYSKILEEIFEDYKKLYKPIHNSKIGQNVEPIFVIDKTQGILLGLILVGQSKVAQNQ
jgi:hypothetical protein